MFKYIEELIQYRIAMSPIDIDEDGHYFVCPRCKQAFRSEYLVCDFKFCPSCGQKWKIIKKENEQE